VTDGNGLLCFLELVEETREAVFHPIFRHRSTMSGNFVHPHPCFSPDNRWIAFCTDMDGADRGNLYLLDLHSKIR